ncbi:DUF58 domain-containing protein [Aquibacillus sp. 3ASR75-11]|uniref:DUF58 domain-containing protein n=1 Tax=Terrihalobacillus insolitus TaxID=2950438 RepID=A0A9X3WUP7_9BACI|nr:DUF58 domain-containing protein [Terrihalobacillus insolitus]MDC3412887.1 DUF58 domain-containing protein [Terrihalobacillus insolitus]MDC3423634.1 DUF58 domain-containing protein [Terrihalobacillus insolitus]
MSWRNNILAGRQLDIILAFCFIFSLVGIISGHRLVFLLVAVLMALIGAGKFYDQRVGQQLHLTNPEKTIRMFVGEETKMSITLVNASFISIINGVLTFQMNDNLVGERFRKTEAKQSNYTYRIPLSVPSNNNVSVDLPFIAKKRGVATITHINYSFPVFLMKHFSLSYQQKYRTKVVVYPKPMEVQGLQPFFNMALGEDRSLLSPFEDLQSVHGVREYVSTDDFRYIHWNASMRKNALQTKVYDRMQDITLTIVVNVSESSRLGNLYISPGIERLLSQAAYLCYYAAQQGYPVEVHFNMKSIGSSHLRTYSSGQAMEDLKAALELLAHIEHKESIFKFSQLLHSLSAENKHRIIILVGQVDPTIHQFTLFNNQTIYHILEVGDGASLVPLKSKEGTE